jgi:serine/threonine protein kinase
MPISPGEKLGPYEILAPIGKGGMGEVDRARDPRLNRDVAIKVLPQAFATKVARERFQREARAASALNHPNICVVHDVGEASGHPSLVMELLYQSAGDKCPRMRDAPQASARASHDGALRSAASGRNS